MGLEQTLNREYDSALEFLYSFVDYERDKNWAYNREHFNLDRIRQLLDALGGPHRSGWFVHVAGTNGKGSVAAMIARALRFAGLKTGLYTSPHLVTFRERIRVDGRMISHEDTISAVSRLRKAQEGIEGLTFFDVWTALAFDHFARESCDAAVIEVGMGGRLDSTNVVKPAVSVITPISIDHRGKLGTTITEVAREKVGIIKPGIPVVSAEQHTDAVDVVTARAKETGSRCILLGRDVNYRASAGKIQYRGPSWSFDSIEVALSGYMQLQNAALSIAALETLNTEGYPVEPFSARLGIERTVWPGRLQTVASDPDIVVDGACNPHAMEQVCEYLTGRGHRGNVVALVSMCVDKDIDETLATLSRCVGTVITTRTDNPRTQTPETLAGRCPADVRCETVEGVDNALERAVEIAGTGGLVIVTGSLYLVGEVIRTHAPDCLEHI